MKIFRTVIMSQNVIAYDFKKVRNKCYKNVRYAIFIVIEEILSYIKSLVHSSLLFQIVTLEARKYTIKILILEKKNVKMEICFNKTIFINQ